MTESQVVTLRISDNTVSKLEEYKGTVGEITGIENPSISVVIKFLNNAVIQYLTNDNPNKLTLLEYLNNPDPDKMTLIELGSGAIKNKIEK